MKTVTYIPKDAAKPFLGELRTKFSRLKSSTQKTIEDQVPAGKMHLLVVRDGEDLKGALVVQGKTTPQGATAFIYGIFGAGIVDSEYYKEATRLLKTVGFSYIAGFGRPAVLRLYKQAGLPFEATSSTESGIFFGAHL